MKVKQYIPGENLYDFYRQGKGTLVVGIKKKVLNFNHASLQLTIRFTIDIRLYRTV